MDKECCSPCCNKLRYRYLLATYCGLSLAVLYAMRACLSLALTVMVVSQVKNDTAGSDFCPDISDKEEEEEQRKAEFDWDDNIQHLMLAAFYVGYILTHVPGGMIADFVGGKFVIAVTGLITCSCTILTPLAARTSPYLLILLRFILGLAQGPLFPAFGAIMGKWAPPKERTTLATIVNSGVPFGCVMGNSFTGLLLKHYSRWDYMFFTYGIFGFGWLMSWLMVGYSSPNTCPLLSEDEKEFINSSINEESSEEKGKVPWKQILLSKEFESINLANFGNDFGFFMVFTELPLYLSHVLHYRVMMSGFMASLPWICMWISAMLSATISDILIQKGWVRKIVMRKLCGGIANIGMAIMLMLASYSGCDYTVSTIFFILSVACTGFTYPGVRVNMIDISPNFAGTVVGIINGLGALGGALEPILVGQIIEQGGTVSEWRICFWSAAFLLIGSVIPFILFASTDVQPWDSGV